MAFIHYVSSTSTSITVYLDGLDTSYAGTYRTEHWYIALHGTNNYRLAEEYDNDTEGQSRFPDAEITGLEPSNWYDVYCVVTNRAGETLATITEIRSDYYILDGVWTLNAAPTINNFTAEITSYSLREIRLSWNVSDVFLGVSTYKIYCYGYDTSMEYKYGGTVDSYSQELYISVDSYEDYNVALYVTTEGADEAFSGQFIQMMDIAPKNLEVTDRGYRYLAFAWSGADDAGGYRVVLDDGNIRASNGCKYPKKELTYNGVAFGVTYMIAVQGYSTDINGQTVYSEKMFNDPVTSLPAPPILAVSQNDGCITVNYSVPKFYSFGRLQYSYADTFHFVLRNESGEVIYTTSVDTADINHPSGTYTFPIQCEPGTYAVEGWTIKSGLQCMTETGEYSVFSDKVVVEESSRPDNWYWDMQNGDKATLAQTITAHDALTNTDISKRYTTNFHYKVWNDFIDKIKEFLVYTEIADHIIVSAYGYTNITHADLVDKAKMTNEDRVLTDSRLNIVELIIGAMKTTGIGEFTKGSQVKGSYIISLVDILNSIE